MANTDDMNRGIRVAIIGGGPGGLSAAIELARLPFVDWRLYEQKPEISEISGGITLQRNTWRLLQKLGASKHLDPKDFFRAADGHELQYRNGKTGAVIKKTYSEPPVAPHEASCRVHRWRLQQALVKEVDQRRVCIGSKLVSALEIDGEKVRLLFEGGVTDEVDLVIGADGIRSPVRKFAFPGYDISYTGRTAYRAVVETSDVEQITGLDQSKVFWYGTNGEWLFTCPLDDHDWEIIGRVAKPDDGNRSTWGRTVEASELADNFSGYCEPVRQLLSLVTKVKRYDYFGGSRLETVTDHVNVALVGDASHPLAGAFGAGAAFALEDSHVLAGSLRWAASKAKGLGEALQLFDSVRSPHYKALYQTVGEIATAHKQTSLEATSEEQNITGHVRNVSWPKNNWMYYHEADQALVNVIRALDNGPEPKEHL